MPLPLSGSNQQAGIQPHGGAPGGARPVLIHTGRSSGKTYRTPPGCPPPDRWLPVHPFVGAAHRPGQERPGRAGGPAVQRRPRDRAAVPALGEEGGRLAHGAHNHQALSGHLGRVRVAAHRPPPTRLRTLNSRLPNSGSGACSRGCRTRAHHRVEDQPAERPLQRPHDARCHRRLTCCRVHGDVARCPATKRTGGRSADLAVLRCWRTSSNRGGAMGVAARTID